MNNSLVTFTILTGAIFGQSQQQSAKRETPETRVAKWSFYEAMHEHYVDRHEHYVDRFVKSEGFGMYRRIHLDDPRFRKLSMNGKAYTIMNLSLLKHKNPVAYLSSFGGLTRKNYKKAKTRSLTSFEKDALSKLNKGQAAIFNSNPKRLALLGAVRASKDCLSCHHASEGELLGAFSYQLQLVSRR